VPIAGNVVSLAICNCDSFLYFTIRDGLCHLCTTVVNGKFIRSPEDRPGRDGEISGCAECSRVMCVNDFQPRPSSGVEDRMHRRSACRNRFSFLRSLSELGSNVHA
jgi:hypothetical protein